MLTLAENAFLRFGKIRLEILSEHESAIVTSEFPLSLVKRKAISRETGGAGYKDFFLNR